MLPQGQVSVLALPVLAFLTFSPESAHVLLGSASLIVVGELTVVYRKYRPEGLSFAEVLA